MMAQSKWEVSIDELVRSFRDGVCALVPVAERVHMLGRQPNAYDDGDHICAAIYRSIVISSIEHAFESGAFLPIVQYDRRISSYSEYSFICDSSLHGASAFICLETETLPFDQALFAILDSNLTVTRLSRKPTLETKFSFLSRCQDGEDQSFERIRVLL